MVHSSVLEAAALQDFVVGCPLSRGIEVRESNGCCFLRAALQALKAY